MSSSKRKRFESPAAALKALCQVKTNGEEGEVHGSPDFR